MTDEQHEALRQRIEALLHDTVSPKVTLDRVILLLQARLPVIHGYGVWLMQDGREARLVSGTTDPGARRGSRQLPLSDADGPLGHVDLYLQEDAALTREEEALVQWALQTLTPLLRKHVA